MGSQLKMDLEKVAEKDAYDEELVIDESKEQEKEQEQEDEDEDDEETLIVKKRLRKLVYDIAEYDKFGKIQIGKDGMNRLEQVGKFLISMLIFEIIDDLSRNNKKTISSSNIRSALDSILAKSSAVDFALELLNADTEKLRNLRTSMSVNKATEFINQ